MKKLLHLIVFASLILTSCKTTYNPSMLQVKSNPNPVLLKKMDIVRPTEQVQNTKTISVSAPIVTIFERNIEANWMDMKSDKSWGKIEVINISAYSKIPLFFPILSGISLWTFNLLGMPSYTQKFSAEYDIIITDLNGRRIKKYNYIGKSKTTNGLYYGKDGTTVGIEAIKDVMTQFDADLKRDAKSINEELEKASNK